MSRSKTSKNPGSKFKRLLGWTMLLALVFSAGLITGERLVRNKSLAPLIEVTDQVTLSKTESNSNKKDDGLTTFAFFDQLARKDSIALSANREQDDSSQAPKKSVPEDAPKKKQPANHAKTKDTEPSKTQKEATKPAPLPARYTLQVAAHPDLAGAKSHMERLRQMGLQPYVISASIPGKGKFYRVRVGKFSTMKEARAFQASLKAKHSLNTFVSPL